ncbi:DUF4442 domain-containing protein [uncultured Chitinophaga sp.]|uniref:DUF4442 domain-containing protein n=1 Tax=uncultured Chitinophaga sp. TaxID=339340 RepID=UPI0025F189D5|nr:DUF4442 domain-containing protein [uncultured Chitinophaga sp.]
MVKAIDHNRVDAFIRKMNSRLQFTLFLLVKLPIALISGVRVTHLDKNSCTAKVPYKWLSQNPFKSTYFACLSMAAEMSTGALAIMYTQASAKRMSMLVTGMEASFSKKAKGITWFTCQAGGQIEAAVDQAVQSGEPVTIKVVTTGMDKDGQLIATFNITWSFKAN